MYRFRRIRNGPDKGSYFHEFFLRGRPDLALLMKREYRTRPKGQDSERRRPRSTSVDLDAFRPCRELTEDEVQSLLSMSDPGTRAVAANTGQSFRFSVPQLWEHSQHEGGTSSNLNAFAASPLEHCRVERRRSFEYLAVDGDDDDGDEKLLPPLRIFPFDGCTVSSVGLLNEHTNKYHI